MCIAKPSVNKSIISTNLIRLSLNSKKIEPTYFVCLMIFFKGKVGRLKTGEDGAYSFMNTGVLNQLSIPLPPVQLQKKYTDIFFKVKQIHNSKHNSLAKIDMLFNSLTQRAFQGEL
jgi:type I restriction enzyme S subunit